MFSNFFSIMLCQNLSLSFCCHVLVFAYILRNILQNLYHFLGVSILDARLPMLHGDILHGVGRTDDEKAIGKCIQHLTLGARTNRNRCDLNIVLADLLSKQNRNEFWLALRYAAIRDYLGDPADPCGAILRAMLMSRAGLVVFPIQDILGYGADTRVNTPGKADGNWRFRLTEEQIASADWNKFARLNRIYARG